MSLIVVVVGPLTEIKTGYWGFEMNKISYFVCLLVCSKIIAQCTWGRTSKWKWLSREIIMYVNMIFAQYKVKM